MFKTSLYLLASLAAGGSLLASASGETTSESERLALEYGDACYIDVATAGDAVVLTAWSASDAQSTYRMVVTQRFGSGGFDIVQEGDIEPLEIDGAPQLLSDMELDVDAEFSARLTTWNADGDIICRWGERI